MHATPSVKRVAKGHQWGRTAHFDPKAPKPPADGSRASHDRGRRQVVKYVVGLALASVGVYSFDQAAKRLNISSERLYSVLAGASRSRATQLALARLVGRRPIDLFAEITHKDLVAWPTLPVRDADRIRVILASEGLAPRDLARAAGIEADVVHRLLVGGSRDAEGQRRILKAFRALSGREISASEFWGAFLAKEVA